MTTIQVTVTENPGETINVTVTETVPEKIYVSEYAGVPLHGSIPNGTVMDRLLTPKPDPDNLVPNGSFHDGAGASTFLDLYSTASYDDITFADDDTSPHGGHKVLQFDCRANFIGYEWKPELAIPVSPGQVLEISIWAKMVDTSGGSATGKFAFAKRLRNAANVVTSTDWGASHAFSTYGGGVWHEFRETWIVPAGCYFVTPIGATSSATSGFRTDVAQWSVRALPNDTGFLAPTFANGWGDFGGTHQTARYRRLDNVVFVEGTIAGGTLNLGAFTLPADMHPAARRPFMTQNGGSGVGRVDVNELGQVVPYNYFSATNTQVGLNFSYILG